MVVSRICLSCTFLLGLLVAPSINCLNVLEGCNRTRGCPDNSQCGPRGCDGMVCLCQTGHVPKLQLDRCVLATDLGQTCDSVNILCRDKLAVCVDGQCRCRPSYVPALDNLRCKLRPSFGVRFALLGETCDDLTTLCMRKEQEWCDPALSQCVCKPGFRPATPAEVLAEPFLGQECRPVNFSLTLPDDFECPDVQLPVSTTVGERCYSYNNCPRFADCLPRGCDGSVCLCIDGYYPTNNGEKCLPVAYLNEPCDDSAVCYDHGRTTDCVSGLCGCKLGFIATSEGRCKPNPEARLDYALFGEICGHIGDKRIICHDHWTTCDKVMNGQCVCQYGTREASAEEKARHAFTGSPCLLTDFKLDVSDPAHCDHQKELVLCQDWRLDEVFWRDWFKGRIVGTEKPRSSEWDWVVEWQRHRERLRKCSDILPPTEEDNWSEEVREMRIP